MKNIQLQNFKSDFVRARRKRLNEAEFVTTDIDLYQTVMSDL